MQHQFASLKKVVGNVIRNTRIQDASYIADIHEWLYEAMDIMNTQQTLVGLSIPFKSYYHKSRLPCGLIWIDAVEAGGCRIPEGGGSRPANIYSPPGYNGPSAFLTCDIGNYATTMAQINNYPWGHGVYYYTENGTLNTSIPDMQGILHYRSIAVDEDGFPQIPDNVAYMNALYWYCRGQMIGSGWQDKQFNHQYCVQQFEHLWAPRAMAEIRLPSPEQMEHRIETFVRFLPNENYYENFFQSGGGGNSNAQYAKPVHTITPSNDIPTLCDNNTWEVSEW